MNQLIIILSLLLFNNIKFINAIDQGATCETIELTSPCINYLNFTEIYLPTGITQAQITFNVTKTLDQLQYLPDQVCKKSAIELYCIASYRKCNSNITGITFPLPSNPCLKNCNNALVVCATYASLFGLTCDTMDTDGKPSYPIEYTSYNLTDYGGSDNELLECTNAKIVANNGTSSEQPMPCIPPLIYVEQDKIDNHRHGNCVLPCPLSVFSPQQYKTKFYSEAILFTISSVCCIFLILTFGVFPNQRTHRGLCIVYLGISVLFLAASYVVQEARELSSVNGDWRCTSDPGRYKSSEDGTCRVGGFFFQIGGVGTILFITLYSFDFFLTMHMITNKYFLQTSIAIWTTTLFLALLPIKHYESSVASAGCWMSDESGLLWMYLCFYVISFLSTAIMVIFISVSMYKVFKMTLLFKTINDKRILILNVRNLFFLLAVLFCVAFSSLYSLYVSYNSEDFTATIEVWVTCLFEKGQDNCPDVVFPQFNLRYLNAVSMALIGLLGLLGLGIDPHVYQIYKESTRFNYLLSLVGIVWNDRITPPVSKTTAIDSNTSSASSGTKEKKPLRKSRGSSVALKKLNESETSTNDDLESSNNNNNLSTLSINNDTVENTNNVNVNINTNNYDNNN